MDLLYIHRHPHHLDINPPMRLRSDLLALTFQAQARVVLYLRVLPTR
jgi:hypothetical protein